MKIMIIGGGGREHAVLKAIQKNPKVTNIFVLPGNGGMIYPNNAATSPTINNSNSSAISDNSTSSNSSASSAHGPSSTGAPYGRVQCVNIPATQLDDIVRFAQKEPIDFAIITPDDPLILGTVDRLQAIGIPCFGPTAKAAALEGSKVFSKNLMTKYKIPTASYHTFHDLNSALAHLEQASYPLVVKADGLALGKGVTIAHTKEEALTATKQLMQDKIFGTSGENIVVEEFMTGPEVSVLAFTDGKTLVPMISAMDHKPIYDGNQGPNTGGMGAIAPNPHYTPALAAQCMEEIFLPTVKAMQAEDRPFSGCIYFGLMLTPNGPKVIEYNCRLGDPETQVVLPLLETDLLEIMQAVSQGRLAEIDIKFAPKAACCVVMASQGYPGAYPTGYEINIAPDFPPEATIYHAGTSLDSGKLKTSGGRVLGITAVANSMDEAIKQAYAAIDKVNFNKAYWRKDIGRCHQKGN